MTDWEESCRTRLGAYLDDNGDLAPPWARFPDYERHCLGWRMGAGEDWLGLWHVFVQQLPKDDSARLSYLRRHPVAPINWADHVEAVLTPSLDDDDEVPPDPTPTRLEELRQLGLIESDVAFATWLAIQGGDIRWPWERSDTPLAAARYATRPLWFWSRQVAQQRPDLSPPPLPPAWRICEQPLLTGTIPPLDTERGLQTLTILLCAGPLRPPWQLGLGLNEFGDSFEDDMGYVDAFRLWAISCIDDAIQLEHYCREFAAADDWKAWLAEQCGLTP